MSTEWHVPDDSLRRYLSAHAGPVERSSIDSHLSACARCRAGLAALRGPNPATDRVWQAIEADVDRLGQQRRWSARLAPASLASPALLAVTAAMVAVLLVLVGAADALGRNPLPVVVMGAPLVPPLLAALAFRPGIDPAGVLAEATPLAGGRLPFLRAGFASTVALGAGLVATTFTPMGWGQVVVWLGPAIALSAVVAAVATWANPATVALSGAALWALVVALWTWGRRGVWRTDQLDGFITAQPVGQAVLVVITVVATMVCVWRRNAVPSWRVRWTGP